MPPVLRMGVAALFVATRGGKIEEGWFVPCADLKKLKALGNREFGSLPKKKTNTSSHMTARSLGNNAKLNIKFMKPTRRPSEKRSESAYRR